MTTACPTTEDAQCNYVSGVGLMPLSSVFINYTLTSLGGEYTQTYRYDQHVVLENGTFSGEDGFYCGGYTRSITNYYLEGTDASGNTVYS